MRYSRNITFSLLFSLIILIIIVIAPEQFLYNHVMGTSPSFSHQEITDERNDWITIPLESTTNCTGVTIPMPEIESVSYNSDGKVLNATIWLSRPFNAKPNTMPSYSMLIAVISDYKELKVDYSSDIQWNPLFGTWNKVQYEYVKNSSRILSHDPNILKFFGNTLHKGYVNLSIDLSTISSPNEYIIYFRVMDSFKSKNGGICTGIDFADTPAYAPPPKISISAITDPITIRPGQEKTTELKIYSTIVTPSSMRLSSQLIKGVGIGFVPQEKNLTSGLNTAILDLKVFENASYFLLNNNQDENQITIPIYSNISFPKIYLPSRENLSNTLKQTSYEPKTIPAKQFSMTLVIKSPLKIEEQVMEFWKVWGPIIALIGGGFASGFAALVFERLRKKRNA